MGVAAFIVCGVAVFYTHRTAHGTTAEEQAAYEIGEKAGEEAPSGRNVADGSGVEHDGSKVFRAAGPG